MGDLATSGHEFVVGLALGAIGIPAGLIVGSVRRLGLALDPILNGIYSTPTLALTPLFVIWFGLGIESKVAIVFIMAFFPLLINTAAARSEEHTSELQSLMRISYAVFCL